MNEFLFEEKLTFLFGIFTFVSLVNPHMSSFTVLHIKGCAFDFFLKILGSIKKLVRYYCLLYQTIPTHFRSIVKTEN